MWNKQHGNEKISREQDKTKVMNSSKIKLLLLNLWQPCWQCQIYHHCHHILLLVRPAVKGQNQKFQYRNHIHSWYCRLCHGGGQLGERGGPWFLQVNKPSSFMLQRRMHSFARLSFFGFLRLFRLLRVCMPMLMALPILLLTTITQLARQVYLLAPEDLLVARATSQLVPLEGWLAWRRWHL